MTNEQEQLITLLFVKHGGFKAVVDMWLYSDSDLNETEMDAIDAWLSNEHTKPNKLKLLKNGQYRCLTAEISINSTEKD